MQILKPLKRDVYIFLPLSIYFSSIFISFYIIENTFNLLSFLPALGTLYVWVTSVIDIKNKNYNRVEGK
ncbi:hypothetical protein, partial [Bacillus thuringiensis]|uniref:hypothetical protein n=2 Tax=Bacillus thuringiensis TaxID=1428 RepID=UPI001C54E594